LVGSLLHKSAAPSGRGYQLIYADYFAHLERSDRMRRLSRSSFCEARDKLSWEAFALLLDRANLECKSNFKPPTWREHRVRAVDGSCIQLPRSEEILTKFPTRSGGFGDSYYPYSNLVVAADVFTCQTTHSLVGNKYSSERDQLRDLLKTFGKGDIAILDRGFDGKNVWKAFDDLQQHYLGRLRVRGSGGFKFNQNLREQVVEVTVETGEIVKIRIVRGPRFRTGNHLFLATNLMDTKRYDRRSLLELYAKRQAVEDVFLHLKNTLHAKNIRSKKLNGVLQEIYAALTMTSIVAGIRYLFEQNQRHKRISFKALAWRLETAIEILLIPLTPNKLSRLFSGILDFNHFRQPGRSSPRWSEQPMPKWIVERQKKVRQNRERGLNL
jgi:hypothetical protein